MRIDLYSFRIVLFFNPPMALEEYEKIGIEYDGQEEHREMMFASSPDTAARAVRKKVMQKIGDNKDRLASIFISEPEKEEDEENVERSVY